MATPSQRNSSTAARWFVDVSAWQPGSSEWYDAMQLLPLHEQQKVQRFVFAKDQKLALGSRVLQRKLIQELFGQAQIDIQRTPENKPYWRRSDAMSVGGSQVSAPATWNYNVSHHGAIVAIAAHPHALVGVDVVQTSERPNARTTMDEFFRAFENHFNASEWAYIRRAADATDQYQCFYRLWSLKEAYIKAIGIGLGFSLLRAEFFFNEAQAQWQMRLDGQVASEWSFQSTHVDAAHIVSVAYGPLEAIWRPDTSSIFSSPSVAFAHCELAEPAGGDECSAWEKRELADLVARAE